MATHTYTVEVEDIPLNTINSDEVDSSEEDYTHPVNLRRAHTDVHLRRRHSQDSARLQYAQYTLPSRLGAGDYLGSHGLHYGSESRTTAWYNTVMTHRRRGQSPNTEEEVVEEITEAMEGDEKLMSDNVDGEILRRETLRDLAKPLRVKKEIRRRLTARRCSHRYTSPAISRMKSLKYTMSMKWYKLRQSVQDTFHDYSLWHKDLKQIEGTFGTGVGSYFRFLRYLFLLNLVIAVIVSGFVLTPQLVARTHPPQPHTSTVAPPSPTTEGITSTILSVSDSTLLIDLTTEIETANYSANGSRQGQTYEEVFGGLDWLTGAGWFNSTELYYGTYSSEVISALGHHNYNMPEAYFLVIAIVFIIYLGVILRRVVVLYKNNYIDTEHTMSTSFVKKVFSSWDFSITEKKAANIKHKSIYNELKEALQEYLSDEPEEGWKTWLLGWLVKLVFWGLVLGVLALLGWATYVMLDKRINKDIIENTKASGLGLLLYPLIVTCIISIFPYVFAQVVKLEGYKTPRLRLYVTLVRTILLELTVLGVLVGFWYTQATDFTSTTNPVPDSTTTASSTGVTWGNFVDGDECWETSLGQEFYRLLIIDFLVSMLVQLATLIFSLIFRKKPIEFSISTYTLHLIYNQTLLWAGFFFCPLTPLIVVVKIIIMFYIQKFILLRCLHPNNNPWRAAQAETVYLLLTLVSLILAFIGYGIVLFKGKTSSACGPFKGYEHYIEFFWNLTDSDQTLLNVISWILKPGVVVGILGVLIILVYCAKSMAEGRAERIKVLRNQLELEIRDRSFLLELTDKVCTGKYKPYSSQAAAPRSPSPRGHHNLTQRASFVFSDNKVHPSGAGLEPRHFSDYPENQSTLQNTIN